MLQQVFVFIEKGEKDLILIGFPEITKLKLVAAE